MSPHGAGIFYRLGFHKDTAPDGAFMSEEIFDVVNERDEVLGKTRAARCIGSD